MRQSWLVIWIILLLGSKTLLSQRSVAYLNSPIRPLGEELIATDNLISLAFQLERGMIYVKASIDGQTGDFILDTGAPGLVINEVPKDVTQAYQAQSCSEEVAIGVKPVKNFSWANRTLRNLEAITLDLSHLEALHAANLEGMIGYELLRNNTLFIDYQRSQLLLLKNKMNVALAAPLASVPFELYDHLPVITVVVNGELLRLGIDTGAATNVLDSKCEPLLGNFARQAAQEEIQGLDQSIQRVTASSVDNIQVGGFEFSTKFLFLDLSHLKIPGEAPLNGLLGYQFLANYRVAIDYPNQKLLLWPLDQ